MDKQAVRDAFLGKFKPKMQDLPTPYLTADDGTTLDGELSIRQLSGKEAIELRKMATVQTGATDKDGQLINELDNAKLTGLTIIRTLYHRESGQPLLDQLIPTQGPQAGNAADLQEVLGMNQEQFNALVEDINKVLGLNKSAVTDAKKNSGTPQPGANDSSTSNLPSDSSGSEASTT